MGKKRTVQKKGGGFDTELRARALSRITKKKVTSGTLHIHSSYNNTRVLLTDKKGGALCFSSAGSLGFKGTRKGTPYAAAKVGELLGEKAKIIGIKQVDASVSGVGGGRESALRAFASKNIEITAIRDVTPLPFNGPRPPKRRRV